jgi:predicted transposase
MQKTVAAKLIPSSQQAKALKATLEVFASACNQALKVAQADNVKRAFDIHRLCYCTSSQFLLKWGRKGNSTRPAEFLPNPTETIGSA